MLEQIGDGINKHSQHLVPCQLELNLKGSWAVKRKIFEADFYFQLNSSSSYFWVCSYNLVAAAASFVHLTILRLRSKGVARFDLELLQNWCRPLPPVRLIPLIFDFEYLNILFWTFEYSILNVLKILIFYFELQQDGWRHLSKWLSPS